MDTATVRTTPPAGIKPHDRCYFPECEGAQVASMVTVEFSSPDRCWRWYCMPCTSTWLYWYQPDRHETNFYGEPVPVRRAGNLLYDYPLASEQVPA
jgi:hypothetical protein